MANITRRERIHRLATNIRRADKAYYNMDRQIVTDSIYDEWKAELKKISPNHKLLSSVGAVPLTKNTIIRKIMMGSLNNVRNKEELVTFLDKFPHIRKFMYTPKVDGLATELVYQDYEFAGAYTRGDGITGMDVSPAIIGISSIPKHIDVGGLWVVRGESHVTFDDFTKVNARLERQGEEPFTLPRAMAAGTLKLIDVEKARKRCLSFLAWKLVTGKRSRMEKLPKDSQRLSFVRDTLDIPTVPRRMFDRDTMSIDELLESCEQWRKELPYPIDGIVFSLNVVKELDRAGSTGKFPKGEVAYKFKPARVWTKLTEVTNQVGRTGKITPVAWFNPVFIGGSRVEKASVFNHDEIKRLGMTYRCKVLVEKACEIIPQIVKAESGADLEPIEVPTMCPRCGTMLIRKETTDKDRGTTVDLFCPNTQTCAAQINGRLVNFLTTIGNLGFGPAIVAKLAPYVEHIYGVYDIPLKTFQRVISVNNGAKLYTELHSNKDVPLNKFIQALGYDQIGEVLAKSIAASFKNVADLLNCTSIKQIRFQLDCGGVRGSTILPTVSALLFANLIEIEEFTKRLNITPFKNSRKGHALTGTSVAITGKLSKGRSFYQKLIEEYDGKYASAVTKKTDYLVAGDGGGDKRKDAETFGVKIITEQAFMELLAE